MQFKDPKLISRGTLKGVSEKMQPRYHFVKLNLINTTIIAFYPTNKHRFPDEEISIRGKQAPWSASEKYLEITLKKRLT